MPIQASGSGQSEGPEAPASMSGVVLAHLRWRKSRRSSASGNCVELAVLPNDAGLAVRNSRDPLGPVLVFTDDEIVAFLGGVRDGDFDDLVGR